MVPKLKNTISWILSKYGKITSQKLIMLKILIHFLISSQKKLKKLRGRHLFGFGRKMGRNGCRPWKRPKFKNFFCLNSSLSYGYLIVRMQFWLRPTIWQPSGRIAHGRKSSYLSLISKISPQGAFFRPKTQTIGLRHIPWLGTIDDGPIWVFDPKPGCADIGILSQQYT